MKYSAVLAALLNLCASSKLAVKETPPDPERVSLPQVPEVQHAGKNGYPELPALETIMSASSKTLSGISAEAKEIEAKMLRVQNENSLRLKRQKSVFDRKLKEQEDKNQLGVKDNAVLAKTILETKKSNQWLINTAKTLMQENAVRRTELSNIQEQLSQVQKFLTKTAELADDSQAPELEVLRFKKHTKEQTVTQAPTVSQPPTAEADLEINPKEEKQELTLSGLGLLEEPSGGLSFLSMESEVALELGDAGEIGEEEAPADADAKKEEEKQEDPTDLINVLAQGVSDLKAAGQKSEADLKQLFLSDFQAGVKRHRALGEQKAVLKNTLTKMKNYEEKMRGAIKKLQETKTVLDKKLHEAGSFLQTLAKITLSKPEDAIKAFGTKKDL